MGFELLIHLFCPHANSQKNSFIEKYCQFLHVVFPLNSFLDIGLLYMATKGTHAKIKVFLIIIIWYYKYTTDLNFRITGVQAQW